MRAKLTLDYRGLNKAPSLLGILRYCTYSRKPEFHTNKPLLTRRLKTKPIRTALLAILASLIALSILLWIAVPSMSYGDALAWVIVSFVIIIILLAFLSPLLILLLIKPIVRRLRRLLKHTKLYIFAKDNKITFYPPGSTSGTDIVRSPTIEKIHEQALEYVFTLPMKARILTYKPKSSKHKNKNNSKNIHCISINLQQNTPQSIFEPKMNPVIDITNVKLLPPKMSAIKLENGLDKHFTLYAQPGQETDTYRSVAKDIVDLLLGLHSQGSLYAAELYEQNIYIYINGKFNAHNRTDWNTVLSTIESILLND